VADAKQMEKLVEQIVSCHGRLDYFFNNAAIGVDRGHRSGGIAPTPVSLVPELSKDLSSEVSLNRLIRFSR
jgi:NAD(P)-dependent dehydrogenase (short-subunit alcohol dehydrogenase family)